MAADFRIRWIAKPVVFALCLAPLGWLAWLAVTGGLGANPIEATNRFLGDWALRFLLGALCVTPLRELGGWPVLARFRRMIGLFAFAYAVLHLSSYIGVDQFFNWRDIWNDIVKRNYITVGMATFLMLTPLAATSTRGMVKRLGGKRWNKLHKLVYVAGVTACFHFYMMRKGVQLEPIIYGGILLVLLGYRVVAAARRKHAREAKRGPGPVPS